MTAAAQNYRWRGIDSHGTARGGFSSATPGSMADQVKRRYCARWRELTVIAVGDGRPAGGIGRHPDTGRRIWWAEREPGAAPTARGQ
jgi:hypothetical protein